MSEHILLDYYGVEIWLPIVISLVSVLLAWLCIRLMNSYDDPDELEDEKLNQKIKATLNPDKLNHLQNTTVEENSSNEDEDLSDGKKKMSKSERENERRIEREQIQNVFKLMEKNKEMYGVDSVGDVMEQLKRYKTE